MTEDEIVADLAAKLPKPDLPESSWPEATPEQPEEFIDKITPEAQLEKQKLFDFFELSSFDRRAPEADKYLSKIIDWARDEAKSSDFTDILRIIDEQERIMGNKLKTNRLTNLYRFVTIRQQRERLIQEEKVLYG